MIAYLSLRCLTLTEKSGEAFLLRWRQAYKMSNRGFRGKKRKAVTGRLKV